MKKVLLFILLLAFTSLSAQFKIKNKTIQQTASGDTLLIGLQGDSTYLQTDKDYFAFNKYLKVNNDTIATRANIRGEGGCCFVSLSGNQSISGNKTFNDTLKASTIKGSEIINPLGNLAIKLEDSTYTYSTAFATDLVIARQASGSREVKYLGANGDVVAESGKNLLDNSEYINHKSVRGGDLINDNYNGTNNDEYVQYKAPDGADFVNLNLSHPNGSTVKDLTIRNMEGEDLITYHKVDSSDYRELNYKNSTGDDLIATKREQTTNNYVHTIIYRTINGDDLISAHLVDSTGQKDVNYYANGGIPLINTYSMADSTTVMYKGINNLPLIDCNADSSVIIYSGNGQKMFQSSGTVNTIYRFGDEVAIDIDVDSIYNRLPTDNVSATFGTSTDFTEFEVDGTLELHGNATYWDDLFFPFTTGEISGSGYPAYDTDSMYYNFVLDTTGVTKCIKYFEIQLPHKWREGSIIYPHVHYKHQTGIGTPKFKAKYKWFTIGGTTDTGWKWYPMEQTTGTTNNTHQMSYNASAGISGAGKGVSSILILQLYLSDTPTDVKSYQFDIHIECDALGSRTLEAK